MSNDILRQRVSTTTCANCRKQFAPGDRVVTVFIVQNIGRNPSARSELGAYLGEDFELAHRDCKNPSLDGRLIIT